MGHFTLLGDNLNSTYEKAKKSDQRVRNINRMSYIDFNKALTFTSFTIKLIILFKKISFIR